MRSSISLEENDSESPAWDAVSRLSSDDVLYILLAASLMWILLQVLTLIKDAVRAVRTAPSCIPDGVEAANPESFIFAGVNVLLRIASAFSFGLATMKWILGGEEAGYQLLACFFLVSATAKLLTTAGLVAHLRSLLVKVAIQQHVRIKFTSSSLLGTQLGRNGFLICAACTACLVVHLRQSPGKLITWLGTSMSLLLWAHSSFKSIGIMSFQVWDELKPTQISVEELTVTEFLSRIGLENAEEESWCDLWYCGSRLSHDDELLWQHRQLLVRNVFPFRKWLSILHFMVVAWFSLLESAVPTGMVCYCLTQIPELQNVEIVGAMAHPDFDPKKKSYYIQLAEDWNEQLTMKFELEQGQASNFFFCHPHNCMELEPRIRSDQVLLEAKIDAKNFGTCNLTLMGVRARSYSFSILAFASLDAKVLQYPDAFPSYQTKLRDYEVDIIRPAKLTTLSMEVRFELDTAQVKLEPVAYSCGTNRGSEEKVLLSSGNKLRVNMNLTASSNLTLRLKLVPKDATFLSNLSSTYTFTLLATELFGKLQGLARKVSSLEAEIVSMQDFGETSKIPPAQQRLEKLKQERGDLLLTAYHASNAMDFDSDARGKPTFLAVGLTGTGKSELCRWMTGDLEKCKTSNSTVSHTDHVIRVSTRAFKDEKLPHIEWLDTPGRGDTRGEAKDKELWNNTMNDLRKGSERSIDRVVWVFNAAWQRGTADRELMLKELRRSFGIHLYKHLSIVLNFLTQATNKTLNQETLHAQRLKFINWIMSVEDETFNWTSWPKLREGVQAEVENLTVHGVNLDPKVYGQIPENLPLSAPYLTQFPPFSHPAGAQNLISLFNATASQKKGRAQGLPVNNTHPQVGPGTMTDVHVISAVCGFQKLGQAKDLVYGASGINIQIAGKELSPGDRAILLPKSAECGDPDSTNWPSTWQSNIQEPRNVLATSEDFYLPYYGHGVDAQKLCLCEAPASREPWRFGQEREIPTFLGRCPGPLKQIDRGEYKKDMNVLIQVGHQVIALAWHWNGNAQPSRSDAVLILDLDTHRHGSIPNTAKIPTLVISRQVAVINGAVYGILADCLLVIDTKSNGTRKLGNSSWFGNAKHFGIVADEEKLYLVPYKGNTVLMVDVGAETFTEIEIPLKWQSNAEKWWWAVIVAGKVFACPWKSGLPLLVWSLNSIDNPAFRGIDLKETDPGHGLVVFEGLLYTAPRSADNIWVINASTEEVVDHFNVLSFTGPHDRKFSGAAVVGRAIAFAPDDISCLLILFVDTRELGCIGLNRNGISSFGVMAAGNQVWLWPRENQDITVVDMAKHNMTNTSEAEEGDFPIRTATLPAAEELRRLAAERRLAEVQQKLEVSEMRRAKSEAETAASEMRHAKSEAEHARSEARRRESEAKRAESEASW